jgi:hypothetical protein
MHKGLLGWLLKSLKIFKGVRAVQKHIVISWELLHIITNTPFDFSAYINTLILINTKSFQFYVPNFFLIYSISILIATVPSP